jgi:hypothetical protein
MKRFLILLAALVAFGFAPTTTTVTAAWTTICEETVGQYKNMQFKVHNTGANPFTDCVVQRWVGPLTTDWVALTSWTACQTLAAGATTVLDIMGNSDEKLRVQAKSAVGTTSYCRPYGN